MRVSSLDPTVDPRWAEFVGRHPRASVFHTPGWLAALQDAYQFRPLAFTTTAPGLPMQDGIVFCEVRSWITGTRLVSLPFSDHCDVLADDAGCSAALLEHVLSQRAANGWRYVDIRERVPGAALPGLSVSDTPWEHVLDLRAGSAEVFRGFHHNSIQRKIRRAEREGVTCEEGCTEALLTEFYSLVVQTRRRHGIPPQPLFWFRALLNRLGDGVTVRVARARGRPIASILTLRHRDTLVYKYGASDASAHSLGAMPLLFWKTVQHACATGCLALDLGRSESDHQGLVTFKEHLGGVGTMLTYRSSRRSSGSRSNLRALLAPWSRDFMERVPERWCVAAGRLLYRHVG